MGKLDNDLGRGLHWDEESVGKAEPWGTRGL